NTFKQEELERRLGLKPLDEIGVPVYNRESRVNVANRKGPWQEVWLLAHKLVEIDTPAFRAFLRQAAESFRNNVQRMRSKPEDVMPWKQNGERWHLGEKGFPPGRRLQWDRVILPNLLRVVREIEPGLEIVWDARDAVTLKVPGIGKGWARVKTKDP